MNAALHRATLVRTVAAFVLLASLLPRAPVAAQDDIRDGIRMAYVNLSRSGSASAPMIAAAAGENGTVQAFWWDRFDGLTTSLYDPASESRQPAVPAPIVLRSVVGEGDGARIVAEPIGAMPELVADTTGRVHAFWLGPADQETGRQALLLSRLRLGTRGWTDPGPVSESASAWALGSTPGGTLHLVYVRPIESERFPAGIYTRRSTDNGATWSAAQLLVPSRYLRLYAAEQLNLSVHARDDGTVFIAWDDPRLGTVTMLASKDGGESWSSPAPMVDGSARTPSGAHVLDLGGAPTLVWKDAGTVSSCELYQQRLAAGDVVTPSAPSPAFPELRSCPDGLRSLQVHGSAELPTLLIAGEGTATLSLFGWDGDRYSRPTTLSFSFVDPETGTRVDLSDLRATLTAEGRLVVVGSSGDAETDGDIWALQTAVNALEMAFAPPSPWSDPVVVAATQDAYIVPGVPATAPDVHGRVHLLWTEGPALRYSHRDTDGRFSRPVTVATAHDRVATPTLLALGDRLHAVWAQGAGPGALGEVVYSSAPTRDAYAPGAWAEPQPLSLPGTAAGSAALIGDDNGTFHVLFAVPLNEGRGVYYTRSADLGSSWSEPVVVVDLTRPPAGHGAWPQVDHTAFAVDGAGTLHAVFVEGSADGPFPPRALWTARSTDGGESWTDPFLIAEGATGYPRLAAEGARIMIVWQDLARGTLSTRSSADYGHTWSYQRAVPGFRSASEAGAVGLLRGGAEAIVLVGMAHDLVNGTVLQASSWDGSRWTSVDSLKLGGAPLPGASAGLDADGSRMHVLSWAESQDGTRSLSHVARSLSTSQADRSEARAPAPIPPTPTAPSVATPTPSPTPRPRVDAAPPRQGTPTLSAGPLTLPMSAVGGIASAVVVVLGAAWVVARKR